MNKRWLGNSGVSRDFMGHFFYVIPIKPAQNF